jgi:hypothetical protein
MRWEETFAGRHRLSAVRSLAVALFLALAWATAPAARADDPDALYKRGVELRKAGKDRDAVDIFQKLREVDKSARVLAQLGLAEQAVGLWVDAEAHLDAAIESASDPWIVKNHGVLLRALAEVRGRLGTVEVWGEPVGAEVLVDGKAVGTLPLPAPVRVVTGNLPITVRAPGFIERTTVVNVVPDVSARERFVLQRAEQVQPVPVARVEAPVHEPPAGVMVLPASPPDGDGAPSAARRSAKWIAWGAGGAALVVAGIGGINQSNAAGDFNGKCGVDMAGTARALPGSGVTDARCATLVSNRDSGFRLEVIGLAAAGALAGAGVVLWLTESHGTSETKTAISCVPATDGRRSGTVVCSVIF